MARAARVLSVHEERGGRYLVISTRGEEVSSHWVDPNRLLCDCEAARRTRRVCAHLAYVLSILEEGCRAA